MSRSSRPVKPALVCRRGACREQRQILPTISTGVAPRWLAVLSLARFRPSERLHDLPDFKSESVFLLYVLDFQHVPHLTRPHVTVLRPARPEDRRQLFLDSGDGPPLFLLLCCLGVERRIKPDVLAGGVRLGS